MPLNRIPMDMVDGLMSNLADIAINVKSATYGAKGDGVTDDSTAIQNALNDVNTNGGGLVLIPRGYIFALGKGLTIYSNTILVIDGTLKLLNNVNQHVITYNNGASNVIITGFGTIDGNSANQTTANPIGGINTGTTGISYSKVLNITIQNCKNWPLNIVDSHDIEILNTVLCNSGNCPEVAGRTSGSTYRCTVRGNTIYGINDLGFSFYGGVEDSSFVDNTCYNNLDGMSIYADTAQPNPGKNIVISNNRVFLNQGAGIVISTANGGNGHIKDIDITGNDVYKNAQNGTAGSAYDIMINGVDRVLISGNKIHDSGNSSSGATGILLQACNHVTVENNNIYNVGVGSTTGTGIILASGASEILIQGNHFWDDQATQTMKFGINATVAPTKCYIKNNRCGTLLSTFVANTGVADIITGNEGYNPVGYLSAYTTTSASGNAYTNTQKFPCRVFVYGGTITSIAINGVGTGVTGGSFLLQPKDTITLVFTGSPMWTWFGL